MDTRNKERAESSKMAKLASNLAIFIFLTCTFHFWYLFCTTSIFYDWQGHVTLSSKEPIGAERYVSTEVALNFFISGGLGTKSHVERNHEYGLI